MLLLRLDQAGLHYGTLTLLDGVDFSIARGEKIGLLGRNGAGKTTLLKVLAGEVALDGGARWVRPGTRIAWLQQTLPEADGQTVYDVVADGLADTGRLLAEYHHLLQAGERTDMGALARVQHQLEAGDGWMLQQRVETTISQLQLPGDAPMAELSGGWRRRVALAQALVGEPDILLLDEPTNHLDIPAIRWLELRLREYSGAIVLITHDRRFLQNVAEGIAELDRGRLTRWQGDYQGFLRFSEQQLVAEERANALFDKRLAQEEAWIRQGIKARRTRNEGRVRALKAMREERRERAGTASFTAEASSRSGKIVAQLEHVGQRYDARVVIDDFSTVIRRGDRIGIVGANGAGKSTLVRILLGKLAPSEGKVTLGTKLDIAYSDQLRGELDPEKDLIDNVCEGREFIDIDGRRRHAISYLGDFLFSPQRVRMPVKALSGGEQNRAVLARLLSKPANLLVLDEPTNDLDIPTMQVLEEAFNDYPGCVLVVTHDRWFLDRVVTGILHFEGEGEVTFHTGNYEDFQRFKAMEQEEQRERQKAIARAVPAAPREKKRTGLGYKEKLELETVEQEIEKAEGRKLELERLLGDPSRLEGGAARFEEVGREFAELDARLGVLFERWEVLELKREGAG
jgi:ATP-binding cassette subfamily F protein uup